MKKKTHFEKEKDFQKEKNENNESVGKLSKSVGSSFLLQSLHYSFLKPFRVNHIHEDNHIFSLVH